MMPKGTCLKGVHTSIYFGMHNAKVCSTALGGKMFLIFAARNAIFCLQIHCI